MQKLIIDTDPGQDIDDLLAIWFALLRPEVDVRAITTVTWPSDKRARLIKRLLRYLGRGDIAVAAGMQYPLRPFGGEELRQQHDPVHSMNHYAFAEPETPADAPGNEDAVDLIIRTVEQHAGEIVLACIAPLTNIACALQKRPDIAPRIKYIALMGGETTLLRAEHNIAFDHVASDIVLRSGIPLFMGTWSVTRQFVLGDEDCARIGQHGELGAAMARAIKIWHPAHRWKPGPVMYDLFPMVWAFERTLYKTEPLHVQVEMRGEFTRGMTVCTGGKPNAEVTTSIDAAGVRELYLKTVLG